MNYIGVSDLKKSKNVWGMLAREKELVLTRDGRPSALIVEISPEGLEESVAAIRRALFSQAVSNVRRRVAANPPSEKEIEEEIQAVRKARRVRP
jgi:hypothetical protein